MHNRPSIQIIHPFPKLFKIVVSGGRKEERKERQRRGRKEGGKKEGRKEGGREGGW